MSGPRGAPPTTLGALARRHLGAYVAGTACVGVSQLALNRVDWLSKSAIDQLFGAVPSLARGPLLGILAFAVVAFCAQVGSHWLIYNAGRDAEYELRGELLHRLHSLGTGFYGKASAGEIMSRASSDLAQVQLLLGFGVLTLLNAALAFASALQVMFGVSWRLALASLVVAPLLVPVTRVLNRRLFQRTRASQDAVGRLTQVVQTNAANMRVVRSLALESRELHRFEDANDAHLAISLALARARGILTMFIGGVIAVGGLVFFWYGGSLLLRGSGSGGISQGEFFAFWLAFEQLFFPMIVLGVGLAVVQRGRAGHARLAEILSVAPEVVDGPDPAPAVTRGALTVKDLGFAYGDRRVLTGVSLEVPPGGSLAIVGRTGSGKSTLAALLARMLPAPRGAIFIDGRDTCDLPLAYVRGAIGYAQQEAFLFSTTVARNIGLSLDDPDSREATAAIRSAAREAQVEPEILSLPQRFDTVVGERGVQLSGGQRQRVALARALVRGSSVLVLDDPISAVDARTEGMILGALERQKDKGTLVLVTHHVAAAARCAEIVVLDEGRIVERGTHAALVAAGGLYAAFAEEQSLAEQLESEPEEAPASEPPASCDDPSRAAAAEEVRAFHEEGAIAGSSDARLVLRLVALLRPHARLVFLSMGALVLVTGAALARPLLMGWVIDRAAARDARGLVHAGLLLTAFTLALFGCRFLQTYLLQIGGARAIADLRLRVVHLLQRLPLGTFDRTPVGRLVARATTDIDAVGEIFASGVLNAIGDLLQLAGILAMMLALDWRLALVAFASVPVLGGVEHRATSAPARRA
jgi:ATP-binding cassette subfamily B protein